LTSASGSPSATSHVKTLALLIAFAWADGRLTEEEKAGVRGAAEVLNLTKVPRERFDQLLENPAKVSELLSSSRSRGASAPSRSSPPRGGSRAERDGRHWNAGRHGG
jgi:hypothetical protein